MRTSRMNGIGVDSQVQMKSGCEKMFLPSLKTSAFFSIDVTRWYYADRSYLDKGQKIQVNLCQKLLFLHQLTYNMTTNCSLNYNFNIHENAKLRTWGEHVVYRSCFCHSAQFLYTTCSLGQGSGS